MRTVALPGRGRRGESEWAVWLTVAMALFIGLLVQGAALGRTQTASAGSTRLSYPASWVRTSEEGALFAAADLNHGGIFGARVSVREVPKRELLAEEGFGDGGPIDVATSWALLRAPALEGYRLLAIEEATVDGREAASVEYAYLAGSSPGFATSALPALMRAIDTIVAGGEGHYVLSFAAESAEFPRLVGKQFPRFRSVHEEILKSWRLP